MSSAQRTFALGPRFSAYASMWDSRDREIRTAKLQGLRSLALPLVSNTGGLDDIRPDPHHLVNKCVALYYDLDSVTAK